MSEQAERAVDAIVRDLSDRAGLDNEWGGIDADVRQEIRAEWARLIDAAFGENR